MPSIARATLLLLLVFSLVVQLKPARGSEDVQEEWTWKVREETRQKAVLTEILQSHARWVESKGSVGKMADLAGANLTEADLTDTDLSGAMLGGVILARANLTRTNFTRANMALADLREAKIYNTFFTGTNLQLARFDNALVTNANFVDARVTNAHMSFLDLSGQDLSNWNLSMAYLLGTNFTNARLDKTNLIGTDLTGTSLKGAVLKDTYLLDAAMEGADLHGARFEIDRDSFPKIGNLARAKNLEYLTYTDDSEALARLQQLFKEAGNRDRERRITYALMKRRSGIMWEQHNYFEYFVNRILFDLPSQFGMNPGRVLLIVLFIFLLSSGFYRLFIHYSKDSGLAVITPLGDNGPLWLLGYLDGSRTTAVDGSGKKQRHNIRSKPLPPGGFLSRLGSAMVRECALYRVALFFSLMSTFNIKFRDVDFGRWLKLLTTKEYDLVATGWARTIAGLQALLSVYFIALLLVTYFGRPFE